MKKSIISLLTIFGVLVFTACEDSVGPTISSDPEAPTITSPSSGTSFILDQSNLEEEIEILEWNPADFGFNAAVEYVIQIDTDGESFDNPINLASVRGNHYRPTVGTLNGRLLQAGLSGGIETIIHVRVKAQLNNLDPLYSEHIQIAVTPFQDSFPPIYMIGQALQGWSLDAAVIVPSPEANIYTTIAEFTANEAFRFFSEPDWDSENWNYPYFADNSGEIDDRLIDAEDGDNNFQFIGTTGWYRITVNMDTYSVQMEEVNEPLMYMTGLAVGGWDQPGTGSSVKMTFIQEGVFEATTNFVQDGDSNFRFFGQADWGPDSYNYPYFADNNGEITPLLTNAQDGDENFEFTGEDGTYYIKVDINNYTVEMEAQ